MKLKDPPADMEVPQEIEIRLSNIDTEKMGIYGIYFFIFDCLVFDLDLEWLSTDIRGYIDSLSVFISRRF